jgi:hypothetical protein
MVFGLDVEAAKKIAIGIVIAAVILAILAAKFVQAAIAKAVVILVLGGLVALSVNQRANIVKCADRIRQEYQSGSLSSTTCKFLGRSFVVSLPNTTVAGTSTTTSSSPPN